MSAVLLPVLREVRLYGRLGREFGRVFRLAVKTPAEAVQALCAVLPGFRQAWLGRDGRAAYHVFVGRGAKRRDIGRADTEAPVGVTEPIRLVPMVAGAKRGGALQTIVGAALIVVGALVDFYSYGTASGGSLESLGYAMIVGGVVQMLSPQRKKETSRGEQAPSYAFDGAVNITEQGGPVPLAYGRVICGSTVVSQGLSSVNLVIPPAAPLPDVDLPAWVPPEPTGGE